jgi:hypothetical protein
MATRLRLLLPLLARVRGQGVGQSKNRHGTQYALLTQRAGSRLSRVRSQVELFPCHSRTALTASATERTTATRTPSLVARWCQAT